MRSWTRSAGLLFCAVASVYNGPAAFAGEEAQLRSSDSPPSVRLISDSGSDTTPSTQPSGAPKVSMNDSGTFSIQINNDISLVEVLRMIGNQAQLSIIPSRDVRGTVPAMDLYNVTASEALDAILHSNGMAWKQKGNLIYVFTEKELEAQEKAARATTTEIFHLYYTPAANAVTMIKPVLSADAQVSSTRRTGGAGHRRQRHRRRRQHPRLRRHDRRAPTIPKTSSASRKVLKEIDHRPQQILIEATIFQANLTENNAMGIDFSLMGGVNFDTLLNNGATAVQRAEQQYSQYQHPDHGRHRRHNLADQHAGQCRSTGLRRFHNRELRHPGAAGRFADRHCQEQPGGLPLRPGAVTDATVLANPKVLALDKQRGEVIVGNEYGYLTTTTTATTSTQTVQFLDTGTILLFPAIRRRRRLYPHGNSPGRFHGGLNSSNLPFKSTTEVTTNVLVKDGNTIVIGGLFQESSQTNRNQVPFLGSLPLAGALFRSKTDCNPRGRRSSSC